MTGMMIMTHRSTAKNLNNQNHNKKSLTPSQNQKKKETLELFVEPKKKEDSKKKAVVVGRAAEGKAGSIEDREGMSMAEGCKKVKNDNDTTNWVLFRFDKNKKKICYDSCGSGGYGEFVNAVDDDLVQYGLLRYDLDESGGGADNDGGFRPTKFVFIHWMGPDVGALVRGRASALAKKVAKELSPHHISVAAESFEDLDPDRIMGKLKSVGFHMD